MTMYWTTSLTILFLAITGIGEIHAAQTNFPGRDDMGPRIAELIQSLEDGKVAGPGAKMRAEGGQAVVYREAYVFRRKYKEFKDYEPFVNYARERLNAVGKRGFIAEKYKGTVRRGIVEYCKLSNEDITWPQEYKGTNIPLYREIHELFYDMDTGEMCTGFVEQCGGTAADRALESGLSCIDF